MAKRFTDTEKFNDKWYRKLPILQKVIWEYLLSECNHAGIFEKFDIELMNFKINAEATEEDLKLFDDRIIFVSDSILIIPKFISFQYGNLNPLNKVHASVLKELKKYDFIAPIKELTSPFIGSKDKDKDKYKENNFSNTTRFIKPNIEEIKEYCIERKNNVNANQFFDFYETKGWVVGKSKMKDWKAAVRTWERNAKGKIENESNNLYPSVERTNRVIAEQKEYAKLVEQNPTNLEEIKQKLTFKRG